MAAFMIIKYQIEGMKSLQLCQSGTFERVQLRHLKLSCLAYKATEQSSRIMQCDHTRYIPAVSVLVLARGAYP